MSDKKIDSVVVLGDEVVLSTVGYISADHRELMVILTRDLHISYRRTQQGKLTLW